jgi:SAM-dependent methyltransferase
MNTTDQTSNLDVYRAADVVTTYSKEAGLQPAEKTIFEEFKTKWADFRLLDIGIGAGRTTGYLAPRVKEYVGVDYSPEMIGVCENRFGSRDSRLKFAVCDARDMSQFADGSFDFVFFSYNGIDYVTHEDRLQILQEIKRIVVPGGWFCFSSHNLRFFPEYFRFPLSRSLATMIRRIKRRRILLQLHPDFQGISKARHAFVHDGSFEFRTRTYYVALEEQIEQLEQAGFRNIRVFSQDGSEMAVTTPCHNQSAWIYYLSQG